MDTLNPFDWPGPEFLAFYAALTALALLLYALMRIVAGATFSSQRQIRFNPVELAMLAGGQRRAADTILLGLQAAGAASVDTGRHIMTVATSQATLPPLLEPFRYLDGAQGHRDILHWKLARSLAPVSERLEQLGLIPTADALSRLSWGTVALTGALMAVGIIKIGLGIVRDRPAEFLFLLVFLTGWAGFALLRRPPSLTTAGRAALRRERLRNSRAIRAPLGQELLLAFALSGGAVLAGTALADFRELLPLGSGGVSDGGCETSGSSSTCSTGGGGGGGCGGCSGGGE